MTEKTAERKAVPERVTARELAQMLDGNKDGIYLTKEIDKLAKNSGLFIVFPSDDRESVWISYYGAIHGSCDQTGDGICRDGTAIRHVPGRSIPITMVGDEIRSHDGISRIFTDVPSEKFSLLFDDDPDDYARGLVIDMSIFDDVEREAEARATAEKRDDGAL